MSARQRRLTFLALVGLILVIAGAHLRLLPGRTDLVLGIPEWLWLHVLVVVGLLVLAWIATDVITGEVAGPR